MACPVCRSELRETERTEGVCSACGKETTVFHKCVNGHVLCPSCAEASVRQAIRDVCLSSDSRDSRQVLDSMLAVPLISARPLKHHLAVACALATAYCNSSQNDRDLPALLEEVMERGTPSPRAPAGASEAAARCSHAERSSAASAMSGMMIRKDGALCIGSRALASPPSAV